MDIEAERVSFPNRESVVLAGRTTFEEPYVKLCIQDTLTDGQEGYSSLLVDIVPYARATALAAGRTPEEAEVDARARYIEALGQHDVDGFEAEMFWDAYQDIEFVKLNPYAVQSDNPYLAPDAPAAEADSEDVGWGPRNMQRTPGGYQ